MPLAFRPTAVPVLIAGMWPAFEDAPETGTTVAILEKEGGPAVLQGYSDAAGEFHGRLHANWVGRHVLVVVREVSFRYDYFNPVRVERWGLFVAVKQERDTVYNGTEGAKNLDPERWANWDSTQEHINAASRVQSAVRRAKLAWPIRIVGFVIALAVGVGGFFLHPAVGFALGLVTFLGMTYLADWLLLHGY